MFYHATISIKSGAYTWTNLQYDDLLQRIVIPYINKQVVIIEGQFGQEIINLSAAHSLRIYKTTEIQSGGELDLYKWSRAQARENDCTQEIIDRFMLGKSRFESKSLLQNIFTPTKQQAFVIMKFGDKILDSAYEEVIKPVIKSFKYRPLRIDEIQDSGRISDQILEEISKSEIVLADLTGERPNCYYEAGFAHAIGKEIVFTIQKGCSVHFDLAGHRFIEWETESQLRKSLQKRFRAIKQRSNPL